MFYEGNICNIIFAWSYAETCQHTLPKSNSCTPRVSPGTAQRPPSLGTIRGHWPRYHPGRDC